MSGVKATSGVMTTMSRAVLAAPLFLMFSAVPAAAQLGPGDAATVLDEDVVMITAPGMAEVLVLDLP